MRSKVLTLGTTLPLPWQAIPGVSAWIMTTVRRGYSLQFAQRPCASAVCSPQQCAVKTFKSSLALHTFTRCMDAALSPLRQMGICILKYLDNWLILAQSQVGFTSHKTLIFSHFDCLGLRVNFAKSLLSPSQ